MGNCGSLLNFTTVQDYLLTNGGAYAIAALGEQAVAVVQQRSQAWRALAWAQHRDGQHTGHWFLAVAGSDLKESRWLHAGPVNAIPRVDEGRVRLLHSVRSVYLDRLVRDMFEAAHHLEQDLAAGGLRLVGEQVNQPRCSDWVQSLVMEVLVSVCPDGAPSESPEAEIHAEKLGSAAGKGWR